MASTAWTARREDLVRELVAARAERDAAVARAQAAAAKLATIRAKRTRQNAERRERNRARDVAEALQYLATAARLVDTIPTDPLAHKHRQDLIAALKEKP